MSLVEDAAWLAAHPEAGPLETEPFLRRHGLDGARTLVAALPAGREPWTAPLLPWTIGLDPGWPGVAAWLAELDHSPLPPWRDAARRARARWARPWLAEPHEAPDDPAEAWARGLPVATLRALLRRWDRARDLASAEAIARIGPALYRAVLAPANERELAIRLATADPVEYGALLVHPLADALPPEAVLRTDPRAGGWLVRRLAVERVTRTERARWVALRDLAASLRDPRVHAVWAPLADALGDELPRDAWRLPSVPSRRDPAVDALLPLLPPLASDPERALLAAVYADPASDDARLVYADWLTERGDPRGELIQLQCLGGPSARPRVRELLAVHGARWSRVPVGASSVEFERGFPARATLVRGADIADPAWATVHTLTSWTLEPGVLRWPHLRRLRLAQQPDVLRSGTLTALDLPWEGPTWDLPDPAGLPAVRELVLRPRVGRFRAAEGRPPPAIPVARLRAWPLDALGLVVPLHVLPRVLRELDAHPTLRRVAVWSPETRVEAGQGWVVRLWREEAGFAAAEAWISAPSAERFHPLLDVLPTLRARELRVWGHRLDSLLAARLRAEGVAVAAIAELPDPLVDGPLAG